VSRWGDDEKRVFMVISNMVGVQKFRETKMRSGKTDESEASENNKREGRNVSCYEESEPSFLFWLEAAAERMLWILEDVVW